MQSSNSDGSNGRKRSGRTVRKVLADGTIREYHYGPRRLPARPTEEGSLGALLLAYQNSIEWQVLSLRTRQTYMVYLREFADSPHDLARNISRRDLLARRDVIARDRGNGAAAGFVRAAGAFFNWVVDREYLEHSPASRIRKPPLGSFPAWTAEQVEIALERLPECLRRVVLLAANTGQRRSDLLALRWSDFDGEAISLTQKKTGEPLTIHATRELRAELLAWKREATAPTILTDEAGMPWVPQNFTERLRYALRRIGLPDGLSIHGVRKFLAAALASQGSTTHQIAAVTGHRTLAMIEHYTRSVDQARLAEEAIKKLRPVAERFTLTANRRNK